MKSKTLAFCCTALIAMAGNAIAAPWVVCGKISDINTDNSNLATFCQIPKKPSAKYEYGMTINSSEPVAVSCKSWDVGAVIQNKDPYIVNMDNPSGTAMRYGGFMFYRGTYATDECPAPGAFRHRYWALGANNAVETAWYVNGGVVGNGCVTDLPIYCRAR